MTSRYQIFFNGVFDILHPGHYDFIRFCVRLKKAFTANLIAAVDTDAKVRADKGLGRPIFTTTERMAHLAHAFPEINKIEYFSSDESLAEWIKFYKPILVKGKQWEGNVVGAEHAQSIIYYNKEIDISTTDIIDRILEKHK